jgi:16S rRNA (guanine966-N2)-methyltransferase
MAATGIPGQRGRPGGTVTGVTRIVAGSLGGRRLEVPPGARTRPTSDRVREALFNTLATLTDLVGARFADLYAGSGAVGLEALSRGAAHILLVENHPKTARTARANITALGVRDRVTLVTSTVAATIAAGTDEPYDAVFADPPYELPDRHLTALQEALADGGWLAPGGILVIERATRSGPPQWVKSVTEVRTRKYGETTLWYGRRS